MGKQWAAQGNESFYTRNLFLAAGSGDLLEAVHEPIRTLLSGRERICYYHTVHTPALDQCYQQRGLWPHLFADGKRIQLAHARSAQSSDPMGAGSHQG